MAGFFQDLLQGAAGTFFGSDFLRDYTHASKTFRPNAYQNAPKLKFLFHVYFQLNPTGLPEANYGLLVKTVKLPSFNFETSQMNQYNRKRIIQTKIKYDTVNITFHDDNGNTIRRLWKGYYNYYYADGTKPEVIFAGARGGKTPLQQTGGGGTSGTTDATYNNRTLYQPSITGNDNWGYQGGTSDPTGVKIPFFKNITVFGFNQHNFVAYTLINPVITSFSHDTYDYAQGAGTMEHQMTLDYETVVYNEGAIDGKSPGNIVTGFGDDANYDRTLSPIARPGANKNILGQGGLVDGVGGAIGALSQGNILGAVQAAGTTYNTFKNTNILNIAKSEVVAGITNSVAQTPNRNVNVATPIFGAIQSGIGTAAAKLSGAQSSPQQIGRNVAGKQVP
jgi:hypothetical protein